MYFQNHEKVHKGGTLKLVTKYRARYFLELPHRSQTRSFSGKHRMHYIILNFVELDLAAFYNQTTTVR